MKKTLIITISIFLASLTAAQAINHDLDVNNDGDEATLFDSTNLQNKIDEGNLPSGDQKLKYDYNCDGEVTTSDAEMLFDYSQGDAEITSCNYEESDGDDESTGAGEIEFTVENNAEESVFVNLPGSGSPGELSAGESKSKILDENQYCGSSGVTTCEAEYTIDGESKTTNWGGGDKTITYSPSESEGSENDEDTVSGDIEFTIENNADEEITVVHPGNPYGQPADLGPGESTTRGMTEYEDYTCASSGTTQCTASYTINGESKQASWNGGDHTAEYTGTSSEGEEDGGESEMCSYQLKADIDQGSVNGEAIYIHEIDEEWHSSSSKKLSTDRVPTYPGWDRGVVSENIETNCGQTVQYSVLTDAAYNLYQGSFEAPNSDGETIELGNISDHYTEGKSQKCTLKVRSGTLTYEEAMASSTAEREVTTIEAFDKSKSPQSLEKSGEYTATFDNVRCAADNAQITATLSNGEKMSSNIDYGFSKDRRTLKAIIGTEVSPQCNYQVSGTINKGGDPMNSDSARIQVYTLDKDLTDRSNENRAIQEGINNGYIDMDLDARCSKKLKASFWPVPAGNPQVTKTISSPAFGGSTNVNFNIEENDGESDPEEPGGEDSDNSEEGDSEGEDADDSESSETSEDTSISLSTDSLSVGETLDFSVSTSEERAENGYTVRIPESGYERELNEVEFSDSWTPESEGEYSIKVVPVTGFISGFIGSLTGGNGAIAEETVNVGAEASTEWEEYCSSQGFDSESTTEKANCIEEEIVPSYFEDSVGEETEVAESLCQDLLSSSLGGNYLYDEETRNCIPSES